ncbi:hypothetical protein GBA52_025404 [Prunus armeniaca]|nr:hypothetical protein GBA52_025404 [Prunus armeniaca]
MSSLGVAGGGDGSPKTGAMNSNKWEELLFWNFGGDEHNRSLSSGSCENSEVVFHPHSVAVSTLTPLTGRCLLAPVRTQRSSSIFVRSSLDTNVSDMSVNAPKGLFPPEPEHYRGPKLKVAIIGAGLAGMSTAFELLDQGHETLAETFQQLTSDFRLEVGADENLLVKDHTHTFVNKGGNIGVPIGAPIHGILAFLSTNQIKTYDKARNAVALALGPVVKALVDPDGALRDVRNLDSKYLHFYDFELRADASSSCRCVLTPGGPYIPLPNEEIIARVTKQPVHLQLVEIDK